MLLPCNPAECRAALLSACAEPVKAHILPRYPRRNLALAVHRIFCIVRAVWILEIRRSRSTSSEHASDSAVCVRVVA
jgi:hypothetical protein